MNTLSSQVWKNRGSCVIFDSQTLGDLLAADEAVSLRQALGWLNKLPDDPPSASIVIYGLQTILEILPPEDANSFLLHRVRPLLTLIQNNWPACGVILAFTAPRQAFEEEPVDDEVLYVRRGQGKIRLSDGLWDGSASVNLKRLVKDGPNGKKEIIGYYVARIS